MERITFDNLREFIFAYNDAVNQGKKWDDIFYFEQFPWTLAFAKWTIDKKQDERKFANRHAGVKFR